MGIDRTVEYIFDPFKVTKGTKQPAKNLKALREDIAEFVKDEILEFTGGAKTSVKRGAWKRGLSDSYKKIKADLSSELVANMELDGDMLDALKTKVLPNGQIRVYIEGQEGAKADGHNNHSGLSTLPAREFIPDGKRGQTFRHEIIMGIKELIKEAGG